MTPALKYYYLWQSAYWLHQFLVLALRLEKPRRDHTELIIHHIVTLWLIGYASRNGVEGCMLILSEAGAILST